MTLRTHLIAIALAGATLAPVAVLAPAVAAAHESTARAAIGDDPIALLAQTALDKRGKSGYDTARNAVADAVGARLLIDAKRLRSAFAAADAEHQTALLAALAQTGVAYRRNTQQPGNGFDCSGLTGHAWSSAGYALPRRSGDQIAAAASRTRTTAQAGDLVQYPGHVMMWLGVDNAIVHSPFSGRDVEVGFIAKRRAANVRFGDPTG